MLCVFDIKIQQEGGYYLVNASAIEAVQVGQALQGSQGRHSKLGTLRRKAKHNSKVYWH